MTNQNIEPQRETICCRKQVVEEGRSTKSHENTRRRFRVSSCRFVDRIWSNLWINKVIATQILLFAGIFFLIGGSLSVSAQDVTPTPSPQELQVPPVAPDFNPAQKPLPELGRVGVDMNRQKPLTIREALALALENNKDIEVARHNVKI